MDTPSDLVPRTRLGVPGQGLVSQAGTPGPWDDDGEHSGGTTFILQSLVSGEGPAVILGG